MSTFHHVSQHLSGTQEHLLNVDKGITKWMNDLVIYARGLLSP